MEWQTAVETAKTIDTQPTKGDEELTLQLARRFKKVLRSFVKQKFKKEISQNNISTSDVMTVRNTTRSKPSQESLRSHIMVIVLK